MGSGLSKEDQEQQKRNKQIEFEMLQDFRTECATIKLLLLGAGESGKSTVLKQMRILHDSGFSEMEYMQQRAVINSNAIQSMAVLIKAMVLLDIPFGDLERECDALLVVKMLDVNREIDVITAELAFALKRLWADSGIQQCLQRGNEYQLNDSAEYFLSDIDRISQPEYRPNEQDMLRARAKTTAIVEINLVVQNVKLRVFDVGGQRSERKKWINCFDNVSAIVFIVAISEYDQVLMEDGKTNRMRESLRLFEVICNIQCFINTSMILFLNKKDLFAKKIEKRPITEAFPLYDGPQTYEASAAYLTEICVAQNHNAKRKIFPHQTCGTDTGQMKFVLAASISTVIQQNMAKTGLS